MFGKTLSVEIDTHFDSRRHDPYAPGRAHSNAKRIAKQLGIPWRARQAALKNEPPTGATGLDGNERLILAHFKTLLAERNEQVRKRAEDLRRQRDELLLKMKPRLEECRDKAAEALQRLRRFATEPLVDGARDADKADRELRSFVDEHRLTRSARPAMPMLLLVLGNVVAVGLESLITAWAYASGSPRGLADGILTALLASSINITISVLAGMASANLWHVKWWRKLVGLVTTGTYVIFTIGYALLLAHLRDALALDPDTAMRQALMVTLTSPFALEDAQTLLMLIGCLLLAGFAFASGLWSRDFYPGYSEISRRSEQCRAAQRALRAQFIAQIDEQTETPFNTVAQRVSDAGAARDAFRGNVSELAILASNYKASVDALQTAAQDVLRFYAATNTRVRTSPPPRSWTRDVAVVFGSAELLPPFEPEISKARDAEATFEADQLQLRAQAADIEEAIRGLRSQELSGTQAFFRDCEVAAAAPAGATIVARPGEQEHESADDGMHPQTGPQSGFDTAREAVCH